MTKPSSGARDRPDEVPGTAAPLTIPVRRLPHAREIALPARETAGAAGMDLPAAVDAPLTLDPGDRALVPTGFAVAIPLGYEGQVRPRSGLAYRHGITALNAPGTIDADYRGEVKVLLINLGDEPFTIRRGDRIAQLVISRHARASLQEAATLPTTERGAGGFGHTGV